MLELHPDALDYALLCVSEPTPGRPLVLLDFDPPTVYVEFRGGRWVYFLCTAEVEAYDGLDLDTANRAGANACALLNEATL